MVVRAGRARMAVMPRALKRTGHTPRAAEATTLAESGPARAHVAERQEARRRQILDAAGQLFYTKGYPGMTMNDLCRALGVTKPAPRTWKCYAGGVCGAGNFHSAAGEYTVDSKSEAK